MLKCVKGSQTFLECGRLTRIETFICLLHYYYYTMNRTKIIIELGFENSFDVMKLRKSIESLLDDKEDQIKEYSIYCQD